jgi:hypothetical protein
MAMMEVNFAWATQGTLRAQGLDADVFILNGFSSRGSAWDSQLLRADRTSGPLNDLVSLLIREFKRFERLLG